MHMKQNTLNSLFASIDAMRDAVRCESAVVRYYPVAQFIVLSEQRCFDKVSVRPLVTLNRVKDNVPEEIEAYKILKPKNRESLDSYLERLADYLDYLDDHATFVEIVEHNLVG